MNVIFEPDPDEIDRRMRDEDALHVLVIDDDRIPTAQNVASTTIAPDGAERWAAAFAGNPPEIAYVPAITTPVHARLAIALAERGVRVVVGTSLERFLALAADPKLAAKLWS